MHLRLRTVLFGIVVLSTFGATAMKAVTDTNPDGSINVGSASLFTALSRGDMNSYDNNITGPSLVVGNVGVGGHGNFSMSDGQIQGDFYMNDYGTFSMSGPAKITGHKRGLHLDGISQQTTLDHANSDMMNLSDMAATEMSSPNSAYTVNGSHTGLTTVNTGQSMTVADSSPFGSKIVLNLQDFVMTSGTFTLQGTAMTTYIINVAHNFSLNNSKVVLSGGLMASHVLFNIRGTGSQVSLNQGTSLQGVLVAYQRKLDLSGGKIFGKAMANQVVITSGGQVVSQ
jgi:hypothetical protein